MKWGFINGFQSLSGLSLAIGVALLRVIKRYVSSEVSLKWPNDVYIQGEKVAGILIEVSGNPDGSCDAIVGVGLNLNMPEADSITQPWTDLASHLNKPMDKNRVVADLINELRQTLREFCVAGLSQFVADWEAHDHFRDSDIKLLIGQREINGIARGISDTGALLVDVNDDGKISRQSFFGGEISVRQA